MADIADIAQPYEALHLEMAFRKFPKPMHRPYKEGEGDRECFECGDILPIGRARLGKIMCVPCQMRIEK